jgi:hypothetical protein
MKVKIVCKTCEGKGKYDAKGLVPWPIPCPTCESKGYDLATIWEIDNYDQYCNGCKYLVDTHEYTANGQGIQYMQYCCKVTTFPKIGGENCFTTFGDIPSPRWCPGKELIPKDTKITITIKNN